ncbi:hypothetical protein LINPERHAP2_LOCUS19014 [Linum perenne]
MSWCFRPKLNRLETWLLVSPAGRNRLPLPSIMTRQLELRSHLVRLQ